LEVLSVDRVMVWQHSIVTGSLDATRLLHLCQAAEYCIDGRINACMRANQAIIAQLLCSSDPILGHRL
jgi:hypothetical protein